MHKWHLVPCEDMGGDAAKMGRFCLFVCLFVFFLQGISINMGPIFHEKNPKLWIFFKKLKFRDSPNLLKIWCAFVAKSALPKKETSFSVFKTEKLVSFFSEKSRNMDNLWAPVSWGKKLPSEHGYGY